MEAGSDKTLDESHVRLFLSVDVEGSSALKTTQNHTVLLRIYKDSRKSIHELETDNLIKTDFDLDDPSKWLPSIIRSFPREEWDWASILTARFKEFHICFVGELANLDFFQRELEKSGITDPDLMTRRHLWKLLGDELIYSFRIESRKQLHSYVVAFLKVLRDFDKNDVDGDPGIRIKGSGWIAGFPVRNKRVDLPAPDLYWKNSKGEFEPHEYPKIDYLGPEMDTGFRVSKFAHPGLMVISFELAELLGQFQTTNQVKGGIVDWEVLKGVWKEKPYPIIWIGPNDCLEDNHKEFLPWSESTNPLVRGWNRLREDNKILEIKNLAPVIKETRERLSPSLGVIPPYIPQEPKPTPIHEDHSTILKLLEALPETDKSRAEQGEDQKAPEGEDLVTPESVQQLPQLK